MNILKIIAVIAIIVAVAFAAIYILGMFEQTKPIAEAATGLAGQAQEYVTNNIPTVVAAAGSVTAIAGTALSKVQSAQKQVADIKSQATSQIDQLKEEKETLTSQFQQQTDTTKQTYETQITDLKKQLEASTVDTTEISKLKAQVKTVEKQNGDFVNSLLTAANGAVVSNPIDGKVYSVLKLPPEVQTVVK